MLKIKALCFSPCHSQIRVSDGAPGSQREALLSGAVVGHREVHADHLHPHGWPGLSAVWTDIFKTEVRHDSVFTLKRNIECINVNNKCDVKLQATSSV